MAASVTNRIKKEVRNMANKHRNRSTIGRISNVNSQVLETAYVNSVRQHRDSHNPAILRRTASKDQLTRDYMTWLSGVAACMTDNSLRQAIQQSTQQFGQTFTRQQSDVFGEGGGPSLFAGGQQPRIGVNLPENANTALNSILSKYQVAA